MNMELNKCYRTRGGRKARIICVDAKGGEPVIGLVELNGKEYPEKFSREGKWFGQANEHPCDLVSEWVDKPEMDRSVLPAWIKAIAMDKDGRWYGYTGKPTSKGSSWVIGYYEATHCYIPPSHAPKWTGDWRDSLLVFED